MLKSILKEAADINSLKREGFNSELKSESSFYT